MMLMCYDCEVPCHFQRINSDLEQVKLTLITYTVESTKFMALTLKKLSLFVRY